MLGEEKSSRRAAEQSGVGRLPNASLGRMRRAHKHISDEIGEALLMRGSSWCHPFLLTNQMSGTCLRYAIFSKGGLQCSVPPCLLCNT